MKNGINKIFILFLGGSLLGLCSCQSMYRQPREVHGPSGQYADPYFYPMNYPMKMYSGIIPPEHWHQPMPGMQPMSGYPPMYQPMPGMPSMPGPYPASPQNADPTFRPRNPNVTSPGMVTPLPDVQQQNMMPQQPWRIEQMEKDLVPPGRDPETSKSKSGMPPFNDKLVHNASGGFIFRGQSPDEESDPFGLDSDDPFAFGAEDTDEPSSDIETETVFEEPMANVPQETDDAEDHAAEPDPVTPRNVPKQVVETTMPTPLAHQFTTRNDFSTRKQGQLSVEPELKTLGQSIISSPQVYRQNWNPGPWTPGSQLGAWPQDEYLADGGDDWEKVRVEPNWDVRGLNIEDTVVHYDTLQNQVKVQPSNRVHIYSPRFGSVRQVQGLVGNEQRIGFGTVDHTTRIASASDRLKAGTAQQRNQAGYARHNVLLHGANTRVNSGRVTTPTGLVALKQNDHVRSFTDLLTHKIFSSSQMAYLAEGRRMAVAWGGIDSVTVNVDTQTPMATLNVQKPQGVLVIGDGETSPKLEVFKVASTDSAQRGEIVDFFIRFDNVGTELLGNLTIMDSLSPRLEYIQGSAGSSVDAEFFTEPNDAGSLVLRWEIKEPLKTGDFGVVRFRCRVQ